MAAPQGDSEIENEFSLAGIECIFMPELKRYWKFPTISGYRKIVRVSKSKSIDIIHAQDVGAIGRSYLAATKLRKSFVFTQPGGPLTHHIPPCNSEIVLFSNELLDGFRKKHGIGKENLHLIQSRIDTAIYKPEQAASRSKAAARTAPIFCCTRHAVEGKGISGVMVARMIRSICSAEMRARSSARRAAWAARSEMMSPKRFSATRTSLSSTTTPYRRSGASESASFSSRSI
jgi:hypothetical protein